MTSEEFSIKKILIIGMQIIVLSAVNNVVIDMFNLKFLKSGHMKENYIFNDPKIFLMNEKSNHFRCAFCIDKIKILKAT